VDPMVLMVLVLFVALGGLGWYLGWGYKGRMVFRYYAQGAFVFSAAVMVPALVLVLVLQAGAAGRLAGFGIVPHPSIRHVVGAAMGLGERPLWLFRADGSPTDLIAFYLDPDARPGWEVASYAEGVGLFLARGDDRVHITASQGPGGVHLTYHYMP
jgi:hypothetical protein